MPQQLKRFRDYEALGVRYILWLDPEEKIAYRYYENGLFETSRSPAFQRRIVRRERVCLTAMLVR